MLLRMSSLALSVPKPIVLELMDGVLDAPFAEPFNEGCRRHPKGPNIGACGIRRIDRGRYSHLSAELGAGEMIRSLS